MLPMLLMYCAGGEWLVSIVQGPDLERQNSRCVPCLPECTLVALAGGYHDTAMFLTVNP